jgi:MFS family permease
LGFREDDNMENARLASVAADEKALAESARPETFHPGTFGALRIPPFRWLWAANLGFFAAQQMQTVVQGWLVYDMTGDPLSLGGISAASGFSMVVCSLFGGVVADRLVKRDLLVATQISLGIIALIIGALIASGEIRYWHLLVSALFSGAIFAFNMPSRQAIIPEIVGDRQLANAIALNASGMNLMRIGGPALAGAALAVISPAGVYFLMAGCYIFVVAMMLMVPRTKPFMGRRQVGVFADLRAGIVYLLAAPIVLTLIGAEFVLVVAGMPYQTLMPVFASDVLQVGPDGLGWLFSACGFGALVGSLGIASLARRPIRGRLLLGSGALFGVGLLGLTLSDSFVFSLFCLALLGAGNSSYFALNNGLVMGMVAPEMRGRVMSVYGFTFGLQPLGTVPLSAIAAASGAPAAYGVGGLTLVLAMAAVAFRAPAVRRLK